MLSDKLDDPGGDPGGEESITGSLVSFRKMTSEDQVMIIFSDVIQHHFQSYFRTIFKVSARFGRGI